MEREELGSWDLQTPFWEDQAQEPSRGHQMMKVPWERTTLGVGQELLRRQDCFSTFGSVADQPFQPTEEDD
jgi:hypothetical protein